ncbi:hypothetical protein HTY52_11570 [Cupriavidus taiwanensis]|uniref:hypothetical protein n=1 Tax=Cupriavidus taiwanensis TaxID=164546 RepID=UPI0015737293|nr:hypothetical protein [Cupriavidus taiwanensis]NSX14709.1 hypothetical protein [Cupriavidus taiwanensis]
MHADDLVSIDDYSPATLSSICARMAVSREVEHMIYRESELDEVWRLLDADVANAARDGGSAQQLQRLETMRALVIEAHDLVGNDGDTVAARERLGRAIALLD